MAFASVKWFDVRKGFGFLIDGQGRDVFVHFTVIEADGFRRLREGETVEYEVCQGPKGFYATWVCKCPPVSLAYASDYLAAAAL